MRFEGRTVIITGASGNLGRAVCEEFSLRGANVVGLDLEKLSFEDAERRLFIATNLLDQVSVDAAAREALERFGRIDALCNIAGGFRMGKPLHETADEDWNFLFDVNVRTVLHTARAIVPLMIAAGGGKIVNVGAFAAQRGAAHMAAYTASKSALIRITEAMAAELRERSINVNCVLPTIIDTPQNRQAMPEADPRRWVAPGELAKTIAFLASDEAKAIHGASIPVVGLV